MIRSRHLLALALVAAILATLTPPGASQAQEDDAVAQLMQQMSSAEKVGQLFLVTFPGSEITEDAAIVELIRDYRIGGVALLPENDNIINEGDTPAQVATLIGQLQQTVRPTTSTLSSPSRFIPLFIAVAHEGNGVPFTSIVNGTTPLPSEMALGATWNPANAEIVGEIAGQELRALGVNMLLGPSLDVLEVPRPGSTGDLGVRAFGGEPFWVGQMGQAYIRGVHQGAGGQVAVVAKHFPGLGASERSLDEELSTVQRTLEKLRQTDMAPFFATAQAEDPAARPDGVLVSHIRFRGLEGGRFVTTRPVSVDSQVLQRLLEQPELIAWRQEGGVTVSDELGVRALRRFYDASEASFNGRRVAQEAFFAGNDVLFLSQFALSDDWEEQFANIRSTITFFREKYETDLPFQAMVDQAVARILRLKLALYDGLPTLSAARPEPDQVGQQVGISRERLSHLGREALTLLSPPSPDLVPAPPTDEDNIVIFTDSRTTSPCASCAPVPQIDPLQLQNTILRLYGPGATGQIVPWRLSSFTFSQLEEHLNAPSPLPTPTPPEGEAITPTVTYAIDSALQSANWIIFATLDLTDDPPQSSVVRRFLAERADALRTPNLIVLCYDAPYHLDATEINKLSAYYVAYSQADPFIEASVRALFGEFAPAGAPPVSVTGIDYDLFVRILPDPGQTITLTYAVRKPPEPEGESTATPGPTGGEGPSPEPTQTEPTLTPEASVDGPSTEPRPEVGDELWLQTSVIADRNGHPVPDGTPVQFTFTYPQEGLEHSITAATRDGVAEATVLLDRVGQLDISVQADPAPRAVALQIVIQEGGPGIILTPTLAPTTDQPTPTPTTEPEEPLDQTPQPTPGADSEGGQLGGAGMGLMDLVLGMIGTLTVGGLAYYAVRLRSGPASRALRLALWCTIGGLAVYVAYALRLPGTAWLRERGGVWAAGWVAAFGGTVPLVVAWILRRRRQSE